ncbi:hypothetical protein [Bradyrhizobium sp.]|uniref:hypothetical protein n=1 Tax=Bradyrhizobium sp. TaxID=376 RepID=UPI0025C5A5C7|nr:hypothetical protein [Bradyrhizobium sp.]
MSQLSRTIFGKAIFGGLAVSLTLGAVQLASGHDLTGGQQALADNAAAIINRSAKTDRAAGTAGSDAQMRTISLRLESLADTSVLVRVPVAKNSATEARNGPAAPSLFKSGARKATVACEPMVSVLTEIAKQLQPGRCVT